MLRTAAGTLIAILGLIAIAALGTNATSQPRPAAGHADYVGSEACAQCHEARVKEFQQSVHGRVEMDGAVISDRTGCESCHGPGSLHVAAAGDSTDPGFRTIWNPAKLSPESASEACLRCHRSGEQFYWKQSPHPRNGVGCLNCHSIHHPRNVGGGPMLKAADVNQMCLSCHKEKRAALARSGHMPLREGSMNCADCHNPHGTPSEHQIRAGTVNELCTRCHADKRGPFLWEHPPVRENCLNCHQPHGSNNEKVLASKRPYLCQRCHVATRHPSTLYDQPDLASNRLFNRSCSNCHSQIHGSNHPSGKYFER